MANDPAKLSDVVRKLMDDLALEYAWPCKGCGAQRAMVLLDTHAQGGKTWGREPCKTCKG